MTEGEVEAHMSEEGWQEPVDLDNCAREPIHVPGAIQPHGYLLAVTEADLEVQVASENLAAWTGTEPADALGRPLVDVVGPMLADLVATARGDAWTDRYDQPFVDRDLPRTATLHRSDDLLVLEVEGDGGAPVPSVVLRDAAIALNRAGTVAGVAEAIAESVRALTAFDRVMVYRFDQEWNGEVIAERRRDDLNTFLGLHYPSTDIPAQARELYRRNWIRLIVDIGYAPVPLVPPVAHDSGRPLDLSSSALRSVSPIHVEYLQNMGVTASMSLSIIIGGELWGLVACHHYDGPLHITASTRNLAEHLGQMASVRIQEVVASEDRARAHELTSVANGLAEAFAASPRWAVEQVLSEHEGDLLKLTDATGVLVVDSGRRLSIGLVPSDAAIDEVLAAWPPGTDLFLTDQASSLGPALRDDASHVGGVLGVSLTLDTGGYVLWFRPELVRTVEWGGDPHNAKIAVQEGDDVRLSPRKSFEKWQEVVRDRAEPWQEVEVGAGLRLARLLSGAFLRRDRDAVNLATDLQRVMLPDSLPVVAGATLDAFSTPDGTGEVGGDWYDAFAVDEHRVALVVGDIAGHGLKAAAAMAQVRNALRAYLHDEPSPASALDRLNRLVTSLLPGEMATAIVAVVDVRTWSIRMAGAGHPDPVVVRDGTARFVEPGRNTVLGYQPRACVERDVDLAPGDVLLLYSDGLVESRRRSLDDGFDLLLRTAADLSSATAPHLAMRLTEAMTIDEREDDVTVLALSIDSGPSV